MPQSILQPHRQRTLRRMGGEPVVLCIQDGTDLNFATWRGCGGLGVIGTNKTQVETRGLQQQSKLAVTPEGLPLGVLVVRSEAPPAKEKPRTLAERRSAYWIEGFRECVVLARNLGRAKGRRRVAGGTSLLEALRAATARARAIVSIDQMTPWSKSSKGPAFLGRAIRSATLVPHSRSVELASTSRVHQGKARMSLLAMVVEEERTPEGANPIQWLLPITLAVNTPEACRRVVECYARRWRIEDWRRILKSGCKVKELANRCAERIARAGAINLVVAWRILLMTLLGRDHPDLSAALRHVSRTRDPDSEGLRGATRF